MTYSFTDTELELLRDAISCAIISEEQIASGLSCPDHPLKKDSKEILKISRQWLLGWYELQEKLGIKREPDKTAMAAISRVAPARRGRPPKDKTAVTGLTLYKIKKGFFDGLTILEMAAANKVSVPDIYTFLGRRGLEHKQYKHKYKGLCFLRLLRKLRARGYKDLADHFKVTRQCIQERASLYGVSEQAMRLFRRNRREPFQLKTGSGLVSYLKDGMEILSYGGIVSLCRQYKNMQGFKIIKFCNEECAAELRMQWFRLRFQEPSKYRLEGETDSKFPGVIHHLNGSWHAYYNQHVHFGYYKGFQTAVDVIKDYVLNGVRPKLCKGQCVRDDDQRRSFVSIKIAEIAQNLGVSKNTVRRHIKKYGIKRQNMPIS